MPIYEVSLYWLFRSSSNVLSSWVKCHGWPSIYSCVTSAHSLLMFILVLISISSSGITQKRLLPVVSFKKLSSFTEPPNTVCLAVFIVSLAYGGLISTLVQVNSFFKNPVACFLVVVSSSPSSTMTYL